MNGTAQGEGRKATLLGMVMPTRRLPGESDFSLCLSVGDGQEYRVEKNVASNMLKEFVYERVMVQGVIIPAKRNPAWWSKSSNHGNWTRTTFTTTTRPPAGRHRDEVEAMEDTFLICEQCGQRFVFTAKEQEAYRRKGFSTPNRCPDCRKRKMKMTAPSFPAPRSGG